MILASCYHLIFLFGISSILNFNLLCLLAVSFLLVPTWLPICDLTMENERSIVVPCFVFENFVGGSTEHPYCPSDF